MCGISGYWDITKEFNKEKLKNIVHIMNEQIRHRGPDEEGMYQKNSFCMGMRRLSIIDLQGGSQPVFNEDHSIVVVYNGEIYNYKRIRKELIERGHIFATNADTEVITHAFEEYGTKSFDMFDGMFSFALFEVKNNILYLVRDRMGEKPLYYSVANNYVIFGSELKCLISTGRIEKKINVRALNQFLQLTYIPSPLTIYENVFKLRPGHFLEISADGDIKDMEYWDIPIHESGNLRYVDAVKHLQKMLEMSVKERMISDVPLGAFLSGGVDSASIVSIMSRVGVSPPETFTIGFNLKEYDERKYAKRAAQFNNAIYYEKVIAYDSFPLAMHTIMEYMDEPFADSSELPTFLLSAFTKEKVTVALTGDAGDELFAGYNKYLVNYYGRLYRKIPDGIKNGVVLPLLDRCDSMCSLVRKVRKVIENAGKDCRERHKALMHMGVKQGDLELLMTNSYMDIGSLDFIDKYFEKYSTATEIQKELYTDLKVVLEGDMLVKVDRMSMIHSLETRIPLLAKDIVEFAMSLPDEYKIRKRQRKRILKDAVRPLLPKGFDKHPKSGFEVPIAEWMRNEMKDELERLLSKERIERQGIFNFEYIEKIKEEHFKNIRNRRDELWVLYVFEKWCEKENI